MAIIYSYPEKTSPAGGDFLVITDSEQASPNKNRTKSLTIDNLASYVITSQSAITGSGTLDTIPIFTGPNTIGDSFMTYNPTSQFFTISKRLSISGDLTVFGRGAFSGPYLRASCPLEVYSVLKDNNGQNGTAGQVLSSTGTGVEWISNTAGSVTGTGITNTLPIWTDGPNGVLGDSVITQDPGNSVEITTGIPAGANCDYRFGIETFSGQKVGTVKGFEFKTGGQSGGFYKSGGFRFENKLAVGRTSDPIGATLDVGTPSDTAPAAYFRNGVVLSNNPGGVQVDNTSMVIGAGNNDIVSGSDNCLAVGNNNQILSDSDNSLAVGQGNIVRNNADNSFAIGQNNVIDGTGAAQSVKSQVLGYQNSLTGSFSSFIAGGQNTVTTSQNSVALGFSHTLAGDDSMFAFGENNTGPSGASDNNSFMIGGNLTGVDGNMVLGFRNDTSSYPATDYSNGLGNTKFVVSVGTVTSSNAMIITEGGVTRGGGTTQVPRIVMPTIVGFDYSSDADAASNGIPIGGIYHNNGQLYVRLT